MEPRGVEPLTFALRIPGPNLLGRSEKVYLTVFPTCYANPTVPHYAGTFPRIPCTITQELHTAAGHRGVTATAAEFAPPSTPWDCARRCHLRRSGGPEGALKEPLTGGVSGY